MNKKLFVKRLSYLIVACFLAGMLVGTAINLALAHFFNPPKNAVTEIYTVKQGDTLWKIAEEYRNKDCRNPYILSFIEEIKADNPQFKNAHFQFKPGDKISITYFEFK